MIVGTLASITLTFNSWRLSAVTLTVAALCMVLSLLALELSRYPFGIQALIGVIGAIGVSSKRGDHHPHRPAGGSTGGLGRSRCDPERGAPVQPPHPLDHRHHVRRIPAVAPRGWRFLAPFAMAIAGGVLLSAIVSFFFVPPAFSLLVREHERSVPVASLPIAAE